MRLASFIIALLLLAGAMEPTSGWLTVVTVLTGLAAFRIHVFWPFSPRPVLDVRMAAFVIAVLLLAGTVDPTRGWMIALVVATGVAMVCPDIVSLDGGRGSMRWGGRRGERWLLWDREFYR